MTSRNEAFDPPARSTRLTTGGGLRLTRLSHGESRQKASLSPTCRGLAGQASLRDRTGLPLGE